MATFTPEDIDIEPSDFVGACDSGEIKELIEILIEDGHIEPKQSKFNSKSNVNDETFWESLDHLKKCRDLLSLTEEEFINNLAKRFQHLR